jgi:hypothetical protein
MHRDDLAMTFSSFEGSQGPALSSIARYIKNMDGQPCWAPTDSVQEKPRFIMQPMFDNAVDGIDLTHRIIEMIAAELWKLRQGNDLLNWLEAERLFAETVDQMRNTKRTQPQRERRVLVHQQPEALAAAAPNRAKHARSGSA